MFWYIVNAVTLCIIMILGCLLMIAIDTVCYLWKRINIIGRWVWGVIAEQQPR